MVKEILDKNNQLDFEIRFYEKLVSQKPDFIDALAALADAYTKRGRYAQGLHVDQTLAHLRPDDPNVFYNLACSYSLIENTEKSFIALERAIALGYSDFRHMLKDPDLQRIRKDVRFSRLARKIKILKNA